MKAENINRVLLKSNHYVNIAQVDQSSGNNRSLSIKEIKDLILEVQEIKETLEIENLAATSAQVNSELLLQLENALIAETYSRIGLRAQVSKITHLMVKIAEQLNNEEMEKFATNANSGQIVSINGTRISRSLSEDTNHGFISILNGRFNPMWWLEPHTIDSDTKRNVARIIRHVLVKGGKSLPDNIQVGLLKLMLNSEMMDVRYEGAQTANGSYKLNWRNRIQDTGLISAFNNEEIDHIRNSLSSAIVKAAPVSILRDHNIGSSSEYFKPITRLIDDKNIYIKATLAKGISDLLEAERMTGEYYNNFSESIKLSINDKVLCFDYLLRTLNQIYKMDSITHGEQQLLYYSLIGISLLTDNKSFEEVKLSGALSEKDDYAKLSYQLTKIDLVKLIEAIYLNPTFDNNRSKEIFNAGLQIIRFHLSLQKKTSEKPLINLIETEKRIQSLLDKFVPRKQQSLLPLNNDLRPEVQLKRCIDIAISEISLHLITTPIKEISWGNSAEFNSMFGELLSISTVAENHYKNSILDLIKNLNSSGIAFNNETRINLEDALDETNKSNLRHYLTNIVYSKINQLTNVDTAPQSLDSNLFLSLAKLKATLKTIPEIKAILKPEEADTIHGQSLIIYRSLPSTISYKDYISMEKLKKRALNLAAQTLAKPSSKTGLLLSGPRGTGKSFFASALAGELALPLIVVEKIGNNFLLGKNRLYSFDEYFLKLKELAPFVLLIDEIEGILPAKTNDFTLRFLSELKNLERSNIPIIKIGTTNSPGAKTVKDLLRQGTTINTDGDSAELNKLLAETVNQECIEMFNSFYFFHQKSVGADFSKEYFYRLQTQGKINGEFDYALLAKYSSGLLPATIETSFSSVLNSGEGFISSDEAIDLVKKLKLNSDEIREHSDDIKKLLLTLITIGQKTINEELDYRELGLASEDIQISEITTLLNTVQSTVTQNDLLELFKKHNKN